MLMKKLFTYFILLVSFALLTQSLSAQEASGQKYYLVVEDAKSLFSDNDSLMVIDKFFVHNFPDEKSSKDIHQRINKIKNVYRFGIASRAEKISNQRRCYIKLEKENYLKTFKKVLQEMGIDYIILNDEKINLNSFINKIK